MLGGSRSKERGRKRALFVALGQVIVRANNIQWLIIFSLSLNSNTLHEVNLSWVHSQKYSTWGHKQRKSISLITWGLIRKKDHTVDYHLLKSTQDQSKCLKGFPYWIHPRTNLADELIKWLHHYCRHAGTWRNNRDEPGCQPIPCHGRVRHIYILTGWYESMLEKKDAW